MLPVTISMQLFYSLSVALREVEINTIAIVLKDVANYKIYKHVIRMGNKYFSIIATHLSSIHIN